MASTSQPGIRDLPNEVLLSIFSFLPIADMARCAAVCGQWHGIVTGFTRLWKGKRYISNRSPRESAETRSVLHALPPFPDVLLLMASEFRLSIFYPRLTLSVIYIGVVKDCPRLKCESLSTRLEIAGDILSYRSTIDFEALRKLRIIKAPTINICATSVYSADDVVASFLGLCSNLNELYVYAETLSGDYLDTLEGIGRLRTLEIECPRLQKLTFLRHCSGALEELRLVNCTTLPSQEYTELRRLQNLRRLRMSGCRFREGDLAVATAALRSLETLNLIRCGFIDDLSILQHCSQLRELCITNSPMPNMSLPAGQVLRLQQLRLPTDSNIRLVRVVGFSMISQELSGALNKLGELGLSSHCVSYLGSLCHCPRLRHLCCEFVCGPDVSEMVNVHVHVDFRGSTSR